MKSTTMTLADKLHLMTFLAPAIMSGGYAVPLNDSVRSGNQSGVNRLSQKGKRRRARQIASN